MKKLARCICLATALATAPLTPAVAASLESYVGQQPEALLKSKADFARAYRSAVKGVDLPAWTKRLAAGKASEVVVIDNSRYLLTSACSSRGCLDEILYVVFDPGSGLVSGFFYLPPAGDTPGDTRTAFSRWYGLPTDAGKAKAISNFLIERAATDAQTLANPPKK